jgi:hypothetical protein
VQPPRLQEAIRLHEPASAYANDSGRANELDAALRYGPLLASGAVVSSELNTDSYEEKSVNYDSLFGGILNLSCALAAL